MMGPSGCINNKVLAGCWCLSSKHDLATFPASLRRYTLKQFKDLVAKLEFSKTVRNVKKAADFAPPPSPQRHTTEWAWGGPWPKAYTENISASLPYIAEEMPSERPLKGIREF